MRSWPPGFRPDVVVGDFFHEPALSEYELTTDRQRDRRARILDAAVEAAGRGGYDSVHVRDIAVRAAVALGTVYHYFPSKVQLLVWALERELIRFDEYLSQELANLIDPFARLRIVVWRLTTAMEDSDRVTETLAQAYVASSIVASAEAEMIRVQTSEMFAHLMSQGSPTDLHRNIGNLLTDVWTSEVLALVHGRRTYPDMRSRLTTVVELLDPRMARVRFT